LLPPIYNDCPLTKGTQQRSGIEVAAEECNEGELVADTRVNRREASQRSTCTEADYSNTVGADTRPA